MFRPILVAVLLLVVACTAEPAESPATPTPAASPTASSARTAAAPRDPFELARSYEASGPDELARRLERIESRVQLSQSLDASDPRLQQAAYRDLVSRPAWREAVYEALPAPVLPAVQANVQAGAELRLLTPPKDELPPDWRIVAPPPIAELASAYRAAADEFGVHWTYLAAIHLVETRMGRIRGDSDAGAKGPMQFLPSTWAAYGEGDINNPTDAIRAAARYLAAHGAPDDMPRALFAYNHSNHYVRAIDLYAKRMREAKGAFNAYYRWEVYYRTTRGDALLYVGWPTR